MAASDRNAPCPCGSGRKSKNCCEAPAAMAAAAPLPDAALLAATFVLAFSSIVYELLLGQALSAFLGHTVLRYSVTIGLYMLAMGIGALIAAPRASRPLLALQRVEVLLTAIGGGSVLLLFLLDGAGLPRLPFALAAHGLIVAIGVLSGMEIPLLLQLAAERRRSGSHSVLGVDYLGAFAGTIVFAVLAYPHLGLLPTAFATAAANAAVGLWLVTFGRDLPADERPPHRRLLAVQAVLLAGLLVALGSASTLTERALALYLS